MSDQASPATFPQVPVQILAQYLRDMSFENPHAPATLQSGQEAPKMDINITLDAKKVESPDAQEGAPELYEVVLRLTAKAERSTGTAFALEVEYGVLTAVRDLDEAQRHALLLIEIPRFAFPFVRQIVSDATQNGGFPPLLLGPVDFQAMYIQRYGKKQSVN